MANVFPSSPFGQKASTNQPYTAAVGEATSKARIPEVHEAASDLQASVERLHGHIDTLENRLLPVLMQTTQDDVNFVRREMMSPIGSVIADRTIEIDKAINRINRLLEALAV